ncbi:hypothetical protein Sros01_43740 [Streptomyces roseochromogenus]|nr:hypothetical protein Sros01_43740 [Streptomyces roseochromogenus]
MEAALARFGRIDVVVNTLRATLPTLRAQRSGHVLNIGSVVGFVTAPAAGPYGASKFALEGVSEALHGESAPLGVRVTIVEPGRFRTDFLSSPSMQFEPASIADYADITEVAEPPLRLQLGVDAIERVEAKLDLVRSELGRWRHVALSTGL